jgi:uncharacterized protein (TIGR00251 family)
MTGHRHRSPSRHDATAAEHQEEGAKALAVWIQPRASRDAVVGEREGMVAIRLQAPPVDGAANAALLRFLARRLGCPTTAVQLLRGERSRCKWVAVEGVPAAELKRRLLALGDT